MSNYVLERLYEANPVPSKITKVEVDRSRALTAEEVDFTVLVGVASEDIIIDLPVLAEDKRGFRVLNLGTGKMTLRAQGKDTIGGETTVELGPGEMLEGAVAANAVATGGT